MKIGIKYKNYYNWMKLLKDINGHTEEQSDDLIKFCNKGYIIDIILENGDVYKTLDCTND